MWWHHMKIYLFKMFETPTKINYCGKCMSDVSERPVNTACADQEEKQRQWAGENVCGARSDIPANTAA